MQQRHNELQLIHIKGNTLEKRFNNYYSFIPSWTALRYDRRPFQLWESVFLFLRHNIWNPLYYKNISMEEESAEINILLLKKIKKLYDERIFILRDNSVFFERPETERIYYKSVEKEYNFNYIDESYEDKVLYRSFFHYSSLGYEIITKYFFYALIGKKKFFINLLKCHIKKDNLQANIKFYPLPALPLSSDISNATFHSIKILTDRGIPLIRFVTYPDFKTEDYSINLEKNFIGFSSGTLGSFGNLSWYLFPIQLKDDMRVYLKFSNRDEIIVLGSITLLESYRRFFYFHRKYIENVWNIKSDNFDLYFLLKKMPLFIKEKIEKNIFLRKSVDLFIGKYKLGVMVLDKFRTKDRLKFIPSQEQMLLMTGPSGVLEKNLPNKVSLYIQYNMDNGKSFKSLIPNWKCEKKRKWIHLKATSFKSLHLLEE